MLTGAHRLTAGGSSPHRKTGVITSWSPSSTPSSTSPSGAAWFIPSGEIYGGTKSAWDYGPLGVELKENIKRQWWRAVVTGRDDVVGLDSSIILPREVWVASGHVEVFHDPLVECLNCHHRHRQDHMQEAVRGQEGDRRSRFGADDRDRLPGLRHQGPVDRAARVQHDAQDLSRSDRDRGGPALSAAGDRAGDFRQLRQRGDDRAPQAAVRYRPDRQELPQRDHPGQLHLPHPRVRADGDGVLRRARDRTGVAPVLDRHPVGTGTPTSASTARTCGCTSTRRRSCRTTPTARSTSSTSSASPATRGANSRVSPTGPTSTYPRTQSIPASTCPSMTRSPTPGMCPT